MKKKTIIIFTDFQILIFIKLVSLCESIDRRKELSYDEVLEYTVMQNVSYRLSYRKAHGEEDKTLENFTDKKEGSLLHSNRQKGKLRKNQYQALPIT